MRRALAPARLPRGAPRYARLRDAFVQAVLLVLLGAGVLAVALRVGARMQARGIPTGFGFLRNIAGFAIDQTIIPYSSAVSTYGDAFLVGLLNTLLVAALGVVLATLIGFAIGLARLSRNYILAKLAEIYVETIRNTPLLLQLLFLYNAVLKPLPPPRRSLSLAGRFFLNNRGLYLPKPIFAPSAGAIVASLAWAVVWLLAWRLFVRRRLSAEGRAGAPARIFAAITGAAPLILAFALGPPIAFSVPALRGFNFVGGFVVLPEFAALVLGLSIYTAAFVAEIVRGGVLSIDRGQVEAAQALGLRRGPILRLVLIPQAMRVIVPPLANQYLNLTKNSSLAVFIGYPDLVQVFAGTTLNQTGAAVQVMSITMAVYLAISLAVSLAMNLYNRRVLMMGER